MLIVIAILSLLVILWYSYRWAGMSTRVNFFGKIIRSAPTSSREIALTFDDGPTLPYSKTVLDCLNRENVKATFFMVGNQIEKHPEFVKDVVNAGHEIGNHSYSHQSLINRSMKMVDYEVFKTEEIFKDLKIKTIGLFRPPYGHKRFKLSLVLSKYNLTNVIWSVDSLDYCSSDASQVANNVISNIHAGAIVLMHDGGGDRSHTCQALPVIIRELKKKGYRFKTVSEMRALQALA